MEETQVYFSGEASYTRLGADNTPAAEGKGRIFLEQEHFFLQGEKGEHLRLPYRNIIETEHSDYRVALGLSSGERLVLERLGYGYEDFLRLLFKLRGEMLLQDMLMHEKVRDHGFEAAYSRHDRNGNLLEEGRCEPRLYQTALVIIPEKSDPVRIPAGEIISLQDDQYRIAIATDYGEKFTFSKMGYQREGFKEALASLLHELEQEAFLLVRELLPLAEPDQLARVARLMRDGRAALRSEIEAVSPELWDQLEKQLESSPASAEYKYLKSLSSSRQGAVGIKRGLMGELTGTYIWFLVPLCSADPQKPGNAVALESFSDTGSGRATYFFRLFSRKAYAAGFKSEGEMEGEVEQILRQINHCMLAVNFRREPIYLSWEKLRQPRYVHYLYALQRLPALRKLRELYIGRVMHKSPEQWRRDVEELLAFNIATPEDDARWREEADGEEEESFEDRGGITAG